MHYFCLCIINTTTNLIGSSLPQAQNRRHILVTDLAKWFRVSNVPFCYFFFFREKGHAFKAISGGGGGVYPTETAPSVAGTVYA